MTQPDVLYVDDMASRLRMTPKAVYQNLHRKTGLVPPAKKIGRRWIWTEAGYQKWLNDLSK